MQEQVTSSAFDQPAATPAQSLARERALDVLVVDDSKSQLVFMESNLRAQGHRTRSAMDGAQALQRLEEGLPDLVLLDVVLPDCTGIDLVASIREKAQGRWLPILLMSAGDSNEVIVRGLDAGADDFLIKPVHIGVLNAKIRSLLRVAGTQAKLAETAKLLERYRENAEGELHLARNLIQHMIKRDGLKDPALEWYVLPSAKFSGDLVASMRTNANSLYILFADASGHGLAAAISGLPVLQVFYAMASKGVAVGEIAREMNRKLKEYLPMGRYLAAQLLCVDFERREVETWNGGMPAGIVLTNGTPTPNDVLHSRQLPLGVAPLDLFDPTGVRFSWSEPTRLVFVSDGLIEAADPAGDPFGQHRLTQIATRHARSGLVAPILRALRLHLKGVAAHDDVSILGVTLP